MNWERAPASSLDLAGITPGSLDLGARVQDLSRRRPELQPLPLALGKWN